MELYNLLEEYILGTIEITQLLSNENVMFIIDNAGYIKWIPKNETLKFWSEDAKIRIVEPDKADDGFELDEYLNGYCYIARKHRNNKDLEDTTAYILLQMFH